MKNKKTFIIAGFAIILGLSVLGGILIKPLEPISINAQTNNGDAYAEINLRAKENNLNPSFEKSEEIASLIMDNLSILYIPKAMQGSSLQQVANAHMNGASPINENNIVNSVNDLATRASAPGYAQTNVEQVKVVRTVLNRMMPELVSSSGTMTDLEAFAVYITTLSQKVENCNFQVSPAQFSASLQTPTNQPFPGSTASQATSLEVETQCTNNSEMEGVVDGYVNSKNRLSAENMISAIGIQ